MKNGEFILTEGGDVTSEMINDARIRANMDEIPTKTAFVEQMCEFLEDQGLFQEGETETIGFDRQAMRVDAVNFDRQNGALAVVVADFAADTGGEPLVKTRIDSLFKAAENFLIDGVRPCRKPDGGDGSSVKRLLGRLQEKKLVFLGYGCETAPVESQL